MWANSKLLRYRLQSRYDFAFVEREDLRAICFQEVACVWRLLARLSMAKPFTAFSRMEELSSKPIDDIAVVKELVRRAMEVMEPFWVIACG